MEHMSDISRWWTACWRYGDLCWLFASDILCKARVCACEKLGIIEVKVVVLVECVYLEMVRITYDGDILWVLGELE